MLFMHFSCVQIAQKQFYFEYIATQLFSIRAEMLGPHS